jgi:transcriptional regulator with XRE-family HTH domain
VTPAQPAQPWGVQATERFGENLLRIRQARKLSQESLARRAGLHRTQISFLENGRRQAGLEAVTRLAGALEVSTESLFEGIRWDPRAGEFVVEDPPELPRV